jgi:hypothetical protein
LYQYKWTTKRCCCAYNIVDCLVLESSLHSPTFQPTIIINENLCSSQTCITKYNIDNCYWYESINLTTIFGEHTPLFYYCLADNHLNGFGKHLGSLTSFIVGQTILSLIKNDPNSYMNSGFSPIAGNFGCITDGIYNFSNFFTYALNLPTFTSSDIIPDSQTNFFDPLDNRINRISPIGHSLQASLGIPGAVGDIVISAFLGMTIKVYDPTLLLPPNTTQNEVKQVASNAVKFNVDSTLAVVRFLNNRTIAAIAEGLMVPAPIDAPKAIVFPPASLPIEPIPTPKVLTPDQIRAKAIFDSIDIVTFMLFDDAVNSAATAIEEINQALFGQIAPPLLMF